MSTPLGKGQTARRVAALGVLAGGAAMAVGRRHPARGAAIGLGAAAICYAAFRPTNPLLGPVVRSGSRRTPRAALTFDATPSEATVELLDALGDAGVPATFFVAGARVDERPDVLERILAEGHQIASAGYDEGALVLRSPSHVRDQLRRTEDAVSRAAGRDALSRLFRAPYGLRGPATWAAVRSAGYRIVGWTTATRVPEDSSPSYVALRASRSLAPGTVLRLSDGGLGRHAPTRPSGTALPLICRAAEDRGLELVTLDQLLSATESDVLSARSALAA
jgi:peptidoglycan/xylan/chitin deacetylase (PgdA/CDA1 family)